MRAYDVASVESHWNAKWEEAQVHVARLRPAGRKYYVLDSTPFPNGSLHLGHVRTYSLGDMTARYQRLRGRCVLYVTGFDSFGLPNEMAATEAGISPDVYTADCISRMTGQLRRLGVSYDWSKAWNTCDPDCYRWTQWLFLELFEAGLVERCSAPQDWCPRCESTLARLQVEEGVCWRCGQVPETRRLTQWVISLGRYSARLRSSLEDLDLWSDRAKAILRSDGGRRRGDVEEVDPRLDDWLVSRQRSWGTPIPMVHCAGCGIVPVPRDELPVLLPVHAGAPYASGPLRHWAEFVRTSCPKCGGAARRDTDTLDCFFDDTWCFLVPFVCVVDGPGFAPDRYRGWLPVDIFQSGYDAIRYLHLYRFLGAVLHERGILEDAEPVRCFMGNDLVLADGRKMSKHLGNAVSPQGLLEEFGADALRVAMYWAGNPQRPMEWRRAGIEKAAAFLDASYRLVASAGSLPRSKEGVVSKAAQNLRRTCTKDVARVAAFIEAYRPNAATEVLADLRKRIEAFAERRVPTGRIGGADGGVLAEVIDDYVVALSPFAPHVAEECWAVLGHDRMVCQGSWPGGR